MPKVQAFDVFMWILWIFEGLAVIRHDKTRDKRKDKKV